MDSFIRNSQEISQKRSFNLHIFRWPILKPVSQRTIKWMNWVGSTVGCDLIVHSIQKKEVTSKSISVPREES